MNAPLRHSDLSPINMLESPTGSLKFGGDGIYQFQMSGDARSYRVAWNSDLGMFILSDRATGDREIAIRADHFDRIVIGRLIEFSEEAV